jgi:chromosome segregation ATPase
MSLFTDILKGLPENAVLRDKVREAEANQAKLETDNAILKDDLREAKMLIQELKQQVTELTHKSSDLGEIELEILNSVGKIDYTHCVASVIQVNFFPELSVERVK